MDETLNIIPFSKIIGQEKAIKALKLAMAGDKIPHAYLFVGVHGIGKRTTALAFAQALNCLEPLDSEGCGRCRACRQLIGGNFPDFKITRPDGASIKIAQIRELNHNLGYKRVSGKYRINLIQNAEQLTEEAANAFLKNLEEPPEGNILIMSVKETLDLLPTIVSRCRKISFNPIPNADILRYLDENKELDGKDAEVLSRISEGSIGRALTLHEDGFLVKRDGYIKALLSLHHISREEALQMAVDYGKKGKKKTAERSGNRGGEVFELLSSWKTWYRDLYLVKGQGPDHLLINIDFREKLKKMSKSFNISHLLKSFEILDRAQRELVQARNLDLLLETTFLGLKRIPNEASQ